MQKPVYINIGALRVCVTKQRANNNNNNRLSLSPILIYKINREKISVRNESIYFDSEWDEQREAVLTRPGLAYSVFGLVCLVLAQNAWAKKNQTTTDKLVCTSAILIKQK